jgi:hypothetical protein
VSLKPMVTNKRIVACIVSLIITNSMAYTVVEPPVKPKRVSAVTNEFNFSNATMLATDVLWRGTSLTEQHPGWSSLNSAHWRYRQLLNTMTFNLYSNASNTTSGSLGDTASVNYLMIESKLGTAYTFRPNTRLKTTFSIHRSNYNWPGASAWLWTGNSCAATGNNQISHISDVSSLQTTDLSIDWQNYKLLYSIANDSSKPSSSGTMNSTTYNASYGKNWGNFLQLTTPVEPINTFYNYQFELGSWDKVGEYMQVNLYYLFNKTTTGVLKVYNFSSSNSDYDSNTGAVGAIRFNYQSPTL